MTPNRTKIHYVCTECGYESAKWYGKCPGCGEWNTLSEELITLNPPQGKNSQRTSVFSAASLTTINQISSTEEERYHTGLTELDRVLGGGIVKGSLILLSGDPGIGKSTILLQICQFMGVSYKILYISGEESKRQIKLRATRLGVSSDNLFVMTETDILTVVDTIRSASPDIVIIDSIQTMNLENLSSSPGSVSQVRECTNILMKTGKELDIPILIVGHVNKEGIIAGPKVLEHIVDAVLYFEGDRHMSYRILRAVKNRFGSSNEIGVFNMTQAGLEQVDNPSMAMLSGRPKNVSGTTITCVMEGSRPIMAEIQALATASSFGNPRRMSTGFDNSRVSLLLAILEKRVGYFFSTLDVYVNVVGGLKLDEPSADLAVAIALISSLKDQPVPEDTIAIGEIGLTGELRSVSRIEERIAEAERLGFKRFVLPKTNLRQLHQVGEGIRIIGIDNVKSAYEAIMENQHT